MGTGGESKLDWMDNYEYNPYWLYDYQEWIDGAIASATAQSTDDIGISDRAAAALTTIVVAYTAPISVPITIAGCDFGYEEDSYTSNEDTDTGIGLCTCKTNSFYFDCLVSGGITVAPVTVEEIADNLNETVSISKPTQVAIGFDYKAKADTCYEEPKLFASINGEKVGEFSFSCNSFNSGVITFCVPKDTATSDITVELTSGDWCSSVFYTSISATEDSSCAPPPDPCEPNPCNGNGECNDGVCDCYPGYVYDDCEKAGISMCGCKENPQYFDCLPKGTSDEPMSINGNILALDLNRSLTPGSWTIRHQFKGDGGACDQIPPQITFSAKNYHKTIDLLPCPGSGEGEFTVCIPEGAPLSDISLSLSTGAWCSSLLITEVEPSLEDVCEKPTQDDNTKWGYNGFTFTAYGSDQYCSPAFYDLVQDAWLTGADTIGLLYTRYQDDLTSTNIEASEFGTPSLESLSCAIETIKDYDMKVALYLYVDVADGSWRANISPTSESAWFKSLQNYITEMADYAGDQDVDILSIGSELQSMTEPKHLGQWQEIVKSARKNYNGTVLYFDNQKNFDDLDVGYWQLFDAMGVNFWGNLSDKAVPTTEDLVEAWKPHVKSITEKAGAVGKGIFFGELGYPSREYCAKDPYNCVKQGNYSDECQNNAYSAVYEVWGKSKLVMGALFWQVGLGGEGFDPNACYQDSVGCCPFGQSTENTTNWWM